METPGLSPIQDLLHKAAGSAPTRVRHKDFNGSPNDAQGMLNVWLARNQDARVINVETLMMYSSASMISGASRREMGLRVWYELGGDGEIAP
ncbi:hypothetical protein [Simplicispira suum]|uniref:hypothetical protein n=1 Tax=Simplicispira suum TaxID=2109915 RepID=UPI0011B28D95|nr:hypothetical protein [Simplicispira suum]